MKAAVISLGLLLTLTACSNPHVEGGPKLGRTAPGQGSEPDEGESAGGETSGSTTGSSTGSTTGGDTSGSTTGSTTGGSTTGGTTGSTTGGTAGGSTGGQLQTYTLFIGNSFEAHEGYDTTGFAVNIDQSHAIRENFEHQKLGVRTSLAGGPNDYGYEFNVQQEHIRNQGLRNSMLEFFGTKTYPFELERPVNQDSTIGKDRGIDTDPAVGENAKVAAVWKFLKPIAYWGATLVDVESTKEIKAKVRVFACDGRLMKELPFVWPLSQTGDREIHFLGFKTNKANVCNLSLTVGDYPAAPHATPHDGSGRAIAIDDFIYGY